MKQVRANLLQVQDHAANRRRLQRRRLNIRCAEGSGHVNS